MVVDQGQLGAAGITRPKADLADHAAHHIIRMLEDADEPENLLVKIGHSGKIMHENLTENGHCVFRDAKAAGRQISHRVIISIPVWVRASIRDTIYECLLTLIAALCRVSIIVGDDVG